MDFELIIKIIYRLYIYLPVVLILMSLFYLVRKILNGYFDYFEDLNVLIISLISLPMIFICVKYIIPSILINIKYFKSFISIFLNIIPATIVLSILCNDSNNIFIHKVRIIFTIYSPIVLLLGLKLIF